MQAGPDPDSASSDDADEELPVLPADEGFEEIAVSEWPDPLEPADSADDRKEAGAPEDLDVTVSSG